ncbi:MAG: putative zinc-binding metallopeptidase [Polyangiaceae bacterium]|nr:putative zinc-binding metallopeptidase [Myxococcales bacterium]MCB9585803.1 putative zinc-binding metallopeptidase [Polyangiaceae bacterium]MCB9607268.1 putative zinc-binding metallopeptidase [Polyangiaceae bacterium]
MQLFNCECDSLVFFENTQCTDCGRTVGFDPISRSMLALEAAPAAELLSPQTGNAYRRCANWLEYDACNWLVPVEERDARYCKACRLNDCVPDLSNETHLALWKRMEAAKRRLLYTLLTLGLPLASQAEAENGLAFRFLADHRLGTNPDGPQVMTGHASGVITINLAEADEVERIQTRQQMGEAYRTLLGHFRHEIGHYYWDVLVRDSPHLTGFRELFGDERIDYAHALEQHYAAPPDPNYADHYVSAYAASHPWEDWAESWAHYLHLVDGLETASTLGIQTHKHARRLVEPTWTPIGSSAELTSGQFEQTPRFEQSLQFEQSLRAWTWLSLAMNELNRSLGMRDCYPFALSAPVMRKLELVHGVVTSSAPGEHS